MDFDANAVKPHKQGSAFRLGHVLRRMCRLIHIDTCSKDFNMYVAHHAETLLQIGK